MSSDPVTVITHTKSGATASIHSFGATVTSFKPAGSETDVFFVSEKAITDGSKAIRGGIPIVFPIFGPPKGESTMPQHGFARVNTWKLASTFDDEAAAGATYTLELADVVNGRGEHNCWSVEQAKVDGTNCKLTYEIRLEPKRLTTTLIVDNTGSDAFDFQCLFHTYFKVEGSAAMDNAKCNVSGLGGYAITDKITNDSGHVQSYDESIGMGVEVDRVFIHPDDHPELKVKMALGDNKVVHMESYGQVDEAPVPVSCVVWNPYIEKSKATRDFGDEEYKDMVCVEPGLIGHQPVLAAGKQARFAQIVFVE